MDSPNIHSSFDVSIQNPKAVKMHINSSVATIYPDLDQLVPDIMISVLKYPNKHEPCLAHLDHLSQRMDRHGQPHLGAGRLFCTSIGERDAGIFSGTATPTEAIVSSV